MLFLATAKPTPGGGRQEIIALLICMFGAVILDRAIAIFLLLFAILSYPLFVIII